MISLVTSLLVILICFLSGHALDVSFIPNDENAPLPLSAKYRESLSKLCGLLKGKDAKLPPELQEKRAVLEKMCQKLAKDDANISSASGDLLKWDSSKVVYTLLGLGGGYVMWNNRKWIKSRIGQVLGSKNEEIRGGAIRNFAEPVQVEPINAHDAAANQQRILEAREARLQRFANLNVDATGSINN